MRVVVCGLWHLGCVTAACLAAAGTDVVGLDFEPRTIADLQIGRPPVDEPGLAELLAAGIGAGRLAFTASADEALRDADVLWVTFDTPVNDRDEADVGFVRDRLERLASAIAPRTLVLVSSQVPVGFSRALARDWGARGVRIAYSPENLRLGRALDSFRDPARTVVGLSDPRDRGVVSALLAPFCPAIEWMSLESAEMSKHAINAFLATSVTFTNELARLCEVAGANAKEVERALRTEPRIGPRAYVAPGAAFAGGTLARDVRFLVERGERTGVATPLLAGVLESNQRHAGWLRDKVHLLLAATPHPVVAVLGLTYKPGTSTLRRSASVELCAWLAGRGVHVQAHDPAVPSLPPGVEPRIELRPDARAALRGADVAVVATEWPEYRTLGADDVVAAMRRPQVIDPNWFLAEGLAHDTRIRYVATGAAQAGAGGPAIGGTGA